MKASKDDLGAGDLGSQGGALAPQQGDARKTTTKGPLRDSTKKPKRESTMTYKKDSSQKIDAAASRVCKTQDFAAGTVASLTVVITKLTKLRDDVQADGDVDWNDLVAVGESYRILDTIYSGYPMVPASEDVEKAATKKVAAKDFVEHAAGELEAAAAEPVDKRALRIAALKMAVALFDIAADDGEVAIVAPEAALPLLKATATAAVAKATADAAAKEEAAKAAASGGQPPAPPPTPALERIEAVAKRAGDAQPPKVDWPHDLNWKPGAKSAPARR